MFGGEAPFFPRSLTKRADKARKAIGLERITLHECRHTFASLMIAAGVNAKALSTYMGHANMPGPRMGSGPRTAGALRPRYSL
ncbi:MAG: tyrosine-type recombinase/integrase [Thermoanaerobaculia bacterium]